MQPQRVSRGFVRNIGLHNVLSDSAPDKIAMSEFWNIDTASEKGRRLHWSSSFVGWTRDRANFPLCTFRLPQARQRETKRKQSRGTVRSSPKQLIQYTDYKTGIFAISAFCGLNTSVNPNRKLCNCVLRVKRKRLSIVNLLINNSVTSIAYGFQLLFKNVGHSGDKKQNILFWKFCEIMFSIKWRQSQLA